MFAGSLDVSIQTRDKHEYCFKKTHAFNFKARLSTLRICKWDFGRDHGSTSLPLNLKNLRKSLGRDETRLATNISQVFDSFNLSANNSKRSLRSATPVSIIKL